MALSWVVATFSAGVFLCAPLVSAAQQDATKIARDSASADADKAKAVTFGAFVDTYFAYQFARSSEGHIAFLTQPAFRDEPNLNLGFAEAKLYSGRWRGRFALQVGTSVHVNYAAESKLARRVQEAVIGYRVAPDVWIDGGIYFSHVDGEGFISRDNWMYTRSLVAEWSPYYETGNKATWSPSSKFTGLVTVVNGWQVINDNNRGIAVGLRLDYAPTSNLLFAYSNFLGNEQPEELESKARFFHDFIVKYQRGDSLGVIATVDYGTQGGDDWWGFALIGRGRVSDRVALAGRLERYSDPAQVIINTGVPEGFISNGVSFGVDVNPYKRLLWRTELRSLFSGRDLFPKDDRSGLSDSESFIVTSLGYTF